MTKQNRTVLNIIVMITVIYVLTKDAYSTEVGRYKTLELVFEASKMPKNPYDAYLLKLEITDPKGEHFIIDGFFDGDGNGGQEGKIWKARICPYMPGVWSWHTVPGDERDVSLLGYSGQFECVESGDIGGIVADGQYFRYHDDGYVYLQGNFLDFSSGLRSTHTFMSETTTDAQRDNIVARQRDFHTVNKINIYFANKGDYKGQSVTPWYGTAKNNDKTRMDLVRWKKYDEYVRLFKEQKMIAEIWFFADDSGFGELSAADKNRLFRYTMARTSAFSHTMYVIALEWAEGWSSTSVTASGNYIQAHNPWRRLLSVHNIQPKSWSNLISVFFDHFYPVRKYLEWGFPGQGWVTFIATQGGNSLDSSEINKLAINISNNEDIPHIDEEFGLLEKDSDKRLRVNMWANFCGGAAGGGTGSDIKAFMRFLSQSRVPFQRMHNANSLVEGGNTRFCLAEIGYHYVVYSQTGDITLKVNGSGLKGRWFNPRDQNASLGVPFNVSLGSQAFTPPDIMLDWVLWITDGSNLNSGIIHPSTGADLTQEIVVQNSNQPLN